VVEKGGLVGVLTVDDLAKALAKELEYSDAIFNALASLTVPKRLCT
jgi:hypothetical protein